MAKKQQLKQPKLVPVTILTGFLCSGKTTLLNRILKEQHGHKIAVIENEFGEAGVDNEILIDDRDEQIVEMNNGCICCTVRGDLQRILGELRDKREQGKLWFERIIIETTGMADPGPVAQTFFLDEKIGDYYLLDSVITVVDAKHGQKTLDDFREAQDQVGLPIASCSPRPTWWPRLPWSAARTTSPARPSAPSSCSSARAPPARRPKK